MKKDEQTALMEQSLRTGFSGQLHMANITIDRLMICDADKITVSRLKEAAGKLSTAIQQLPSDQKELWSAATRAQMKIAIERVKALDTK